MTSVVVACLIRCSKMKRRTTSRTATTEKARAPDRLELRRRRGWVMAAAAAP
jgi:hypothetical protein